MTGQEFQLRLVSLLAEERQQPLQPFYLSFAGEEGFRGGVIVEACGIAHAVVLCNSLGINPHGQVLGVPIPEKGRPQAKWFNRLLSKTELCELWPDMQTLGELESEE